MWQKEEAFTDTPTVPRERNNQHVIRASLLGCATDRIKDVLPRRLSIGQDGRMDLSLALSLQPDHGVAQQFRVANRIAQVTTRYARIVVHCNADKTQLPWWPGVGPDLDRRCPGIAAEAALIVGDSANVVAAKLIRTAGPGQKHHTLNRAAYSVGGLVSGGHIQEGFAFRELSAALNSIAGACDDFDHAQRTLRQAFEDGMASPRSSDGPRAGGGDQSRSGKAKGAEARPEADEGGLELTEDGVALAFEAEHKDALRYCHGTGGWYVWTGSHWKINRDKLTFCWARALVRNLNRQADFKTKAITGKASFAAAVEKFAQADRAFAVTAETWDRDLDLIGTPGGTVDLRTGQLRAADRADYITKVVAVAPAEAAGQSVGPAIQGAARKQAVGRTAAACGLGRQGRAGDRIARSGQAFGHRLARQQRVGIVSRSKLHSNLPPALNCADGRLSSAYPCAVQMFF